MNSDLQKKWMHYEKKWRFRDFYFNKILRRHGILKYFHREPVMPRYAHKWVMTKRQTNDYIYDLIQQDKPFMVCRFGNTELHDSGGQSQGKDHGAFCRGGRLSG